MSSGPRQVMSAGRRPIRGEARPAAHASVAPERPQLERRRTARLVLRRPRADDLDWMTALHSDPRNYTHAPDRAHTPARARALAQSLLNGWETDPIGYWLAESAGAAREVDGAAREVDDTSAGTAHEAAEVAQERLGMAGVRPSTLAGRPCFNLYFRFVVTVRGQGFGAEASREGLIAAAAIDPACPVVVRTRAANAPARRLAEGLGLTRRADLDAATSGFVVYVSDW